MAFRRQEILKTVAGQVERLKPGERIKISRHVLSDIGRSDLVPGYTWTPAELIMENVVSSSWTIRFWEDPVTMDVTFERLEKESEEPTYVSPDRRAS